MLARFSEIKRLHKCKRRGILRGVMNNIIQFPVRVPAVNEFVNVRFPRLNKNDTLDRNDEAISNSFNTERCKVVKVVTASPELFRVIGDSLLADRPELWEGIGGSDSDHPDLSNLTAEHIFRSETLMRLFRKTAWTNVVVVQTSDGSETPFVVNTEGYSYARYVGRLA